MGWSICLLEINELPEVSNRDTSRGIIKALIGASFVGDVEVMAINCKAAQTLPSSRLVLGNLRTPSTQRKVQGVQPSRESPLTINSAVNTAQPGPL